MTTETTGNVGRAPAQPHAAPADERVDVALIGARMVLENKVVNATACLANTDWKPSRSHLEGCRNTMKEALEYIGEALRALTTQPHADDVERVALEIAHRSHDHGSIAWCAAYDAVRAALASPAPASTALEPSAYLKHWWDEGTPRCRVDLSEVCEPWLAALNPTITPLYAAPASTGSDELRRALERLERACDDLAANRSQETYLRMIDADKAEPFLEALDEARREARSALSSTSREGGRG